MKRETDRPEKSKAVERLFPFVLRAKKLLVGRETVGRSKSKLQFVLITSDISESSRDEILRELSDYPVVQHWTAADLERFFFVRNAKVIGFAKSSLASSIYAELKQFRLNAPPKPPPAPATPPEQTHG